jgi:L-lysine exporter family protein LysE/ArgO
MNVDLMRLPFINGLIIGLGLIVAIGAQNVFIIKQGLKKRHAFLAAGIAGTCDAVLILIGIKAFDFLRKYVPVFQIISLYLCVIFLCFYGIMSLWNGVKKKGLPGRI